MKAICRGMTHFPGSNVEMGFGVGVAVDIVVGEVDEVYKTSSSNSAQFTSAASEQRMRFLVIIVVCKAFSRLV